MIDKAIITSCSNKFFPSVLNLIGSLKQIYPEHPIIYVYDLGLLSPLKMILKRIDRVKVLPMPHFVEFWRSCYTWKTYILANPLAELNFYIDAGSEVYDSLDEIFLQIEKVGYYAVEQKVPLNLIVPSDYRSLISLDPKYYQENCLTAGIVGFRRDSEVSPVLSKLHDMSIAGMCLGFSKVDANRNRGVDKSEFVRDCQIFRHDTTLWSMLFRSVFGDRLVAKVDKTGECVFSLSDGRRLIRNFRRNYVNLTYVRSDNWNSGHRSLLWLLTDLCVQIYIYLKRMNLCVKRSIGFKGVYKKYEEN